MVALLPAKVVSSAFSRFPAVRKYLRSPVDPRGRVAVYLFALLIIPGIRLLGTAISTLLRLSPLDVPDPISSAPRLIGLVVVSFLYGLVFTGGLNEETGWTGFALPRLQARYSPLIASIVLWFLWILWHMPIQMAGFWNADMESFIRALVGTFFARFVFTWLYNVTKGGILAPMLFHVSANVCFAFLPSTYGHMFLEAGLAVLIVYIARMWRKLPDDHQAMLPV